MIPNTVYSPKWEQFDVSYNENRDEYIGNSGPGVVIGYSVRYSETMEKLKPKIDFLQLQLYNHKYTLIASD